MTAVTRWEVPATVTPPPRRHLRSVPTGAAAIRATPAMPGVPQRRAMPTGWRLRLTARGRRTLLVVALVAGCLSAGMLARAWAAPSTPASPSVIVQPGQTLSEVAHRAYPKLATSDAVAKVQQANDLNSLHVRAGQQLRLPR